MFKKSMFLLLVCTTFLFASIDFNKASKDELMQINGIGEKKAQSIIEYRKTHKIKNADDLLPIKGFGTALVSKIKNSQTK